jgi:ECF transporter S component (folate family)
MKKKKLKTTHRQRMATRTLASCALLAALSVVLARLIVPMPNAFTRFSIEAVPIFLAGMLFGPLAGGMVGFSADLVGCLFSGFGYNPIFCVPPILYGVFAGLCRPLLAKKISVLNLLAAIAPAVVFGSVLYQSWALGYVSGKGFLFFFTTRSVQFAITMVVDVLILNLLFRGKLFQHIGVWPPKKKESK